MSAFITTPEEDLVPHECIHNHHPLRSLRNGGLLQGNIKNTFQWRVLVGSQQFVLDVQKISSNNNNT